MNRFESFSVDDIRRLRNEESEKLKVMSGKEISEYFSKASEKLKKKTKKSKSEKVAI